MAYSLRQAYDYQPEYYTLNSIPQRHPFTLPSLPGYNYFSYQAASRLLHLRLKHFSNQKIE